MKKRKKLIGIVFITFLSSIVGFSQEIYKNISDYKVTIEGTSTIHDWEVVAEKVNATGEVVISNNKVQDVKSFQVIIPVESLESGKSSMNEKIFEALKREKHPNIIYNLKEVKSITSSTITAVGNLSISGTTREVELTVNYKLVNNTLQLSGQYVTKMTTFNVEPPTAVFGTIKSGDLINIKYSINLKK